VSLSEDFQSDLFEQLVQNDNLEEERPALFAEIDGESEEDDLTLFAVDDVLDEKPRSDLFYELGLGSIGGPENMDKEGSPKKTKLHSEMDPLEQIESEGGECLWDGSGLDVVEVASGRTAIAWLMAECSSLSTAEECGAPIYRCLWVPRSVAAQSQADEALAVSPQIQRESVGHSKDSEDRHSAEGMALTDCVWDGTGGGEPGRMQEICSRFTESECISSMNGLKEGRCEWRGTMHSDAGGLSANRGLELLTAAGLTVSKMMEMHFSTFDVLIGCAFAATFVFAVWQIYKWCAWRAQKRAIAKGQAGGHLYTSLSTV